MNSTPAPASPGREWDARRACEVWPDQHAHWAPVSWKDHLHDFAVFHDGTIVCSPAGSGWSHIVPAEVQAFAVQLNVRVCTPEWSAAPLIDSWLQHRRNPDGMQVASWAKDAAPVYQVEHGVEYVPVQVRQTQFAHVPGGKPVKRGDEAHFLWIRFEVSEVVKLINPRQPVCVCLTMTAPSAKPDMYAFNNIQFGAKSQDYPGGLFLLGGTDLSKPLFWAHGCDHIGGKNIRAAILGGNRDVTFKVAKSEIPTGTHRAVRHVVLSLPAKIGAHVDVLLPATPVDDDDVAREMRYGFDGALRETRQFWRRELRTRTRICLPEPLLQNWVDHYPRLSAMIAQKDPATGEHAMVTGQLTYEAIWATLVALDLHALDLVGFGRETEKYLEPFRLHQGETAPPSRHLSAHPGYLTSPKRVTGHRWLSDHGAILWAAANHGLLTRDGAFLARWLPSIVKACEFICEARRVRYRGGYPGILPPGAANDRKTENQSCWNDAWSHKGLKTSAFLLQQLGHRDAARFTREARAYRDAFQRAYRTVTAKSKKWKAPDGTWQPFTPPTLGKALGDEAAHPFSLDTGACSLVFGELFPASDPIMKASLRWLREGPQTKLFRKFSSPFQVPVLDHEISSCEPGYSWNLFHSFELGDREKFTEGLYSLFAAGASRQNFVSCETREGIFGNTFSHRLALMLTRASIVHEEADTLHLLRMTPLAFFRDGGFRWENVPTWFGEISITARHDVRRKILHIDYTSPTRTRSNRTILHLPPIDCAVLLNGRQIDPTQGRLSLSPDGRPAQ